MTSFEKYIHSLIKHYPALKAFVVACYQRACSVVPISEFQANHFIHREGYFYGFHDKCPWSHNNTKMLAHKFDSNKSVGLVEQNPIALGYFEDPELLSFRPICSSSAWNWQQGSMLQWIGDTDYIIYNDIVDDKPCAKVVDVSGKELSVLPCHIVAVSHDGKWAISYSYIRLGAGMKGYGYGKPYTSNKLEDNKMFLVNLANGEQTAIIDSVQFSCCRDRNPDNGFFYYAQFSPNGQRISYLFRAKQKFGDLATSLCTSNLDGSDRYVCPGSQFTHKIWFDDSTLLSYFKPNAGGDIGFYLIRDKEEGFERLGESCLLSDGHPQYNAAKGQILLDTYPDRYRRQYLKLYNTESNRQTLLLNKRIPFQFRYERRCDYHPRYDRLKQKVCFDSGHSGVRAICVMNLDGSDSSHE